LSAASVHGVGEVDITCLWLGIAEKVNFLMLRWWET